MIVVRDSYLPGAKAAQAEIVDHSRAATDMAEYATYLPPPLPPKARSRPIYHSHAAIRSFCHHPHPHLYRPHHPPYIHAQCHMYAYIHTCSLVLRTHVCTHACTHSQRMHTLPTQHTRNANNGLAWQRIPASSPGHPPITPGPAGHARNSLTWCTHSTHSTITHPCANSVFLPLDVKFLPDRLSTHLHP